MDLHAALRDLRERAGLRQEDVAATSNISQSTISRMERAERARGPFDNLVRYVETCGGRIEIVPADGPDPAIGQPPRVRAMLEALRSLSDDEAEAVAAAASAVASETNPVERAKLVGYLEGLVVRRSAGRKTG